MRPLSGRHAVGGFKITTLGRGGFASPVLHVVRHERRTSLAASPGCWHAYPVGVSAVLTLAPGSSPWRLQSAHGGTPTYVTDGDSRAGMRRARSALRGICGHQRSSAERVSRSRMVNMLCGPAGVADGLTVGPFRGTCRAEGYAVIVMARPQGLDGAKGGALRS